MNDMSAVITPKSDQINADDLIGGDMTIIIRDVQIKGGQEQPVSILFDGSDKAFRPCKSMSRVLVAMWGADARQYVGRSLTLYRDPTVKWGGLDVGGIRISHMSDIEASKTMALTATKGSRKPFTVKPLVSAPRTGEFTRADAQRDLMAVTSLEDLKACWSRKGMAPFRESLSDLLAELKGEFEGRLAGPTDEQRGDQRDGTDEPDRITDDLIATGGRA